MPDDTISTVTATVAGKAADRALDQWSFGSGKYKFLANISAMGIIAIAFIWFLQDKFATVRSDAAYYQARIDKLEELQDKRNERQWQNQSAIAKGLQEVALQLARIETTLRIPPGDRKDLPEPPPPKAIELRPPTP